MLGFLNIPFLALLFPCYSVMIFIHDLKQALVYKIVGLRLLAICESHNKSYVVLHFIKVHSLKCANEYIYIYSNRNKNIYGNRK